MLPPCIFPFLTREVPPWLGSFALHSSGFRIYHITSSVLSDKHITRWSLMSGPDSLQVQRICSVRNKVKHLFIVLHLHSSTELNMKT